MVEYELFYVVGESQEANLVSIKERVVALVEQEGGAFLEPETEEKRKFAYEIQKERRGTYIAKRFTLPSAEEAEDRGEVHPLERLNKALLLDKEVLRFIITRADELPELKPIERVERKKKVFDRRGPKRAMPSAPVTDISQEKNVSSKEIDSQLKDKLDI